MENIPEGLSKDLSLHLKIVSIDFFELPTIAYATSKGIIATPWFSITFNTSFDCLITSSAINLIWSFNISNSVVAFEIFTEALAQFQGKKKSTISAFDNNPFQTVERDFAFLLPKSIKANDLVNKIKKIDKKIINKVTIFDVYEGEKIENNTKSIAIRVLLQPIDKTFTDEEIENISNQIIDTIIMSFSATLRK